MRNALLVAAMTALLATACFAGISVSSPASGSTVSSPVHFVAYGSTDVYAMRVYVDNNSVYATSGHYINSYVSVGGGSHSVTIQGWSSTGAIYKVPFTINVGSSSGSYSAPSGSYTYNNIDQMTGWSSCGACAGIGGNGPVGTYWMKQFVGSPSMDGKSAEFYNGGRAWGNSLWWKQLGANAGASHFVYDLYFYINYPNNAQALEFDVNQSVSGRKYIFGTQCNLGAGQWDVWNTAGVYWVHTGIGCSAPPAYRWNHLTLEFARVNGGTQFVAVTLNGVKKYINRWYKSMAVSANELNTAFQMDLKGSGAGYNVWLDKVRLTVW